VGLGLVVVGRLLGVDEGVWVEEEEGLEGRKGFKKEMGKGMSKSYRADLCDGCMVSLRKGVMDYAGSRLM